MSCPFTVRSRIQRLNQKNYSRGQCKLKRKSKLNCEFGHSPSRKHVTRHPEDKNGAFGLGYNNVGKININYEDKLCYDGKINHDSRYLFAMLRSTTLPKPEKKENEVSRTLVIKKSRSQLGSCCSDLAAHIIIDICIM